MNISIVVVVAGDGLGLGAHVRNVIASHEASKDGHHHLLLALGNVLGQSIDASTDLASDRDRILGIGEFFLHKLELSWLWKGTVD